MVEYSDLTLEHVNDGINNFVAMKFKSKITDEVCNLLEKPRVKFGGNYLTKSGVLVFGTGFLFDNIDEASKKAKLLVEVTEVL